MSQLDLDGHGLSPASSSKEINDQAIDELIGVCRGVIFDGTVNELETNAMLDWLDANRNIADQWPANILYHRVSSAMQDGKLDSEEHRDLLELLVEITNLKVTIPNPESNVSSLPICQPAPNIEFQDKVFCFVGRFVSGDQNKIEIVLKSLGGKNVPTPTMQTNYLVIGGVGSTEWLKSIHGHKIDEAAHYRELGVAINIVSEEHWLRCVDASIAASADD